MKKKKFRAEVLSGHKEDAVEVPFDPAAEWGIPAKPLWKGRRGHWVKATVNGVSFDSAIVPRRKTFYMLIDAEAAKSARLSEGGVFDIAVELRAE